MTIAEQIAEYDRINRQRSLTNKESLALEKLIKLERGDTPKAGRRLIEWTPYMDATIRDLRGKGWGLIAIGVELGVNSKAVDRRVRELGLPIFSPGFAAERIGLERRA